MKERPLEPPSGYYWDDWQEEEDEIQFEDTEAHDDREDEDE